jgi:hypothetical protein
MLKYDVLALDSELADVSFKAVKLSLQALLLGIPLVPAVCRIALILQNPALLLIFFFTSVLFRPVIDIDMSYNPDMT